MAPLANLHRRVAFLARPHLRLALMAGPHQRGAPLAHSQSLKATTSLPFLANLAEERFWPARRSNYRLQGLQLQQAAPTAALTARLRGHQVGLRLARLPSDIVLSSIQREDTLPEHPPVSHHLRRGLRPRP